MGIGHIFEIDDHYTNIDQWLIIGDNYLLNVFTDYSYSNSLISREWLTKVKRRMKLYCIRTHIYFFFICCGRWWLYTDWNTTILVAETFLLNTICLAFHLIFKNIEILLLMIFIRMDCNNLYTLFYNDLLLSLC